MKADEENRVLYVVTQWYECEGGNFVHGVYSSLAVAEKVADSFRSLGMMVDVDRCLLDLTRKNSDGSV